MNIFSGFSKKRSQPQETNYLALTLTPNKTIAAIWILKEENVQILGIAKKSFENPDGLIHEAAAAIDTAGKQAQSDVSQVVFGLSASYFEGQNLQPESSAVLKNLAEELDLNAQAYVSLASSISHFLKIKESVTPQAILIGCLGEFTEVHLIKNNKVDGTKTAKSQATIEKILQLIGQIKTDQGQDLPSRIIVYGAVEDSHIGKEIIKHQWQDLFASTPKVEFLDDEQIAEAIAFSQAADVLGHDPVSITPAGQEKNEETKRVQTLAHEGEAEKPDVKTAPALANDMGFVEGEDILEVENKASPGEKKTEEPQSEVENIREVENYAVAKESQDKMPEELPTQTAEAPKKRQSLLEKITTLSYLPNFIGALTKSKSRKTVAITLTAILLLVLAAFYLASQTLTQVEVIIKANTKSQQGDFKATVQRGGAFDAAKNVIPGEEITASEDGNQKAVTTGTKNTGDYAKGQVKVFNWTTDKKSFSKGTVIISAGGIKFTLDSDIEVASRSASLPGESQTNVTAQNFGTGGNLNAGTDFTFQQYDELLYSAKNDNAISGGDEKQVTVVSQDDMDKLSKSLLDSLSQKAKSSLKDTASGRQINEDAIAVTVTKKQFDKNLNDEAALLNLDMTVAAKAVVFNQDDLKNLLAETVNQDSAENLEARPQNVQITQIKFQLSTDKLLLSGQYNADLVPKFNDDELKGKIAGKSIKEAGAIIKQIPQVSDVNFKFSPKLFIYLTLPRSKSKITFKIEGSQ